MEFVAALVDVFSGTEAVMFSYLNREYNNLFSKKAEFFKKMCHEELDHKDLLEREDFSVYSLIGRACFMTVVHFWRSAQLLATAANSKIFTVTRYNYVNVIDTWVSTCYMTSRSDIVFKKDLEKRQFINCLSALERMIRERTGFPTFSKRHAESLTRKELDKIESRVVRDKISNLMNLWTTDL